MAFHRNTKRPAEFILPAEYAAGFAEAYPSQDREKIEKRSRPSMRDRTSKKRLKSLWPAAAALPKLTMISLLSSTATPTKIHTPDAIVASVERGSRA
jgi:hypothetical protein